MRTDVCVVSLRRRGAAVGPPTGQVIASHLPAVCRQYTQSPRRIQAAGALGHLRRSGGV